MKLLWIIIIILLILGLIYYTQDTIDVVEILGKHSLTFTKNVYNDISKKSDDFKKITNDITDNLKD